MSGLKRGDLCLVTATDVPEDRVWVGRAVTLVETYSGCCPALTEFCPHWIVDGPPEHEVLEQEATV